MPVLISILFQLLDKSDAINSQRLLADLTMTGVSHRAAIWCSYGQYNIAFLISQILLNIDTTYAMYGLTTYNTEGVCTCICNIANFLSNVVIKRSVPSLTPVRQKIIISFFRVNTKSLKWF